MGVLMVVLLGNRLTGVVVVRRVCSKSEFIRANDAEFFQI